MERNLSKKHVPFCPTRIALVDQYMFPEIDTSERLCTNGVSHAIYACNGDISRTLPLTMWPKVNEVHPQITQSSFPHFGIRDPAVATHVQSMQIDRAAMRLEGFYNPVKEYDPYQRLEWIRFMRQRGGGKIVDF